jgi:hypothetical protein
MPDTTGFGRSVGFLSAQVSASDGYVAQMVYKKRWPGDIKLAAL